MKSENKVVHRASIADRVLVNPVWITYYIKLIPADRDHFLTGGLYREVLLLINICIAMTSPVDCLQVIGRCDISRDLNILFDGICVKLIYKTACVFSLVYRMHMCTPATPFEKERHMWVYVHAHIYTGWHTHTHARAHTHQSNLC